MRTVHINNGWFCNTPHRWLLTTAWPSPALDWNKLSWQKANRKRRFKSSQKTIIFLFWMEPDRFSCMQSGNYTSSCTGLRNCRSSCMQPGNYRSSCMQPGNYRYSCMQPGNYRSPLMQPGNDRYSCMQPYHHMLTCIVSNRNDKNVQ